MAFTKWAGQSSMDLVLAVLFILLTCGLFPQEVKAESRPDFLKVLAVEEKPFFIRGKDAKGNEDLQGFVPDLMRKMVRLSNFRYELEVVHDNQYGGLQEDGNWTGMVGQLVNGSADIAALLTVTGSREKVIDFSKVVLSTGVSVIIDKPEPTVFNPAASMYVVFQPFRVGAWFFIFLCYLVVGFVMWLYQRFHQNYNPKWGSESNFTAAECFWFVLTALCFQGFLKMPRDVGSRVLAATWFGFSFFVLSLYFAGLVERISAPVETKVILPVDNVEELATESMKYGALRGSSVEQFFKDSNVPTYKKMWETMQQNADEVMVDTIQEGIQKMKQEKYAFLTESTATDYLMFRDCNIIQVGGLLQQTGLAFGFPKGSKEKQKFDDNIKKMAEDGALLALYNKWWKEGSTCQPSAVDPAGPETAAQTSVISLDPSDITTMGGPGILLAIGLILSLIITLIELCIVTICKHKSWTPGRWSKKWSKRKPKTEDAEEMQPKGGDPDETAKEDDITGKIEPYDTKA